MSTLLRLGLSHLGQFHTAVAPFLGLDVCKLRIWLVYHFVIIAPSYQAYFMWSQ